jgi:Gly-Xaa carboxypeptidase
MSKYTALAQDEGHSLDHEKSLIAYHQTIRHHRRAKSFTISAILTTLSGLLAIVYILRFGYTGCNAPTSASWPLELQDLPACPQYPALEPPSDKRAKFEKKINDAINSEAFFNKSVARMQGALWIPTESFDDMGKVGEDERWEIFGELHAYFEKTFPLV